eukprot:TRINITY_DN28178_c0_g1_i1.p1 TRINITY_DN28178_c0_g1~~TRINITY_DN28178_c0_g1_i1.p1  ORF type:complete len:273 (+),score=18.98 TRINITY_DN28178_c0_g1_i1:106-924(+)
MSAIAIVIGGLCFCAGVGVFLKLSSMNKAEGARLAQVSRECNDLVPAPEPMEPSPISSPMHNTPLLGAASPSPDKLVEQRSSMGHISRQHSGISAHSYQSAPVRSVPPINVGLAQTQRDMSSTVTGSTTQRSPMKVRKERRQRQPRNTYHHGGTSQRSSHSFAKRERERQKTPGEDSLDELQMLSSEVSARRKEFSTKLCDHIIHMTTAIHQAQGAGGVNTPIPHSHSARSLDMEDSWSACDPQSPYSNLSHSRYERTWSPLHPGTSGSPRY